MSTPFPDPIIKPFSNTGDNAPPPIGPISTAANQETGFPVLESTPLNAGGIPVTREEFNGAFNFYTKQILALVSGARFTFNAALSTEQGGYPLGAVLYCASNNSLQRSLINNNTANFITTPSFINDGINWSAVVIDDIITKNVQILNQGELVFFDSANSNHIAFLAPASLSTSSNYLLPTTYPIANGQSLTSTASGVMAWNYGALGDTTGGSPAGRIGEVVTSTGSLALTTSSATLTSIPLSIGNWVISLQMQTPTIAGIPQTIHFGIFPSTSFSGTLGDNEGFLVIDTVGGGSQSISNFTPGYLAAATTFYFLIYSTVAGAIVEGRLTATRIG